MAFDPKVFSQMILEALRESARFFNKCFRGYDGLVTDRWAKSIDVPKMPILIASKVAVAVDAAARKGGDDIDTVNLPFSVYTVPLTSEIENKFATNDQLVDSFAASGVLALEEQLDADVYAAAVANLPEANIMQQIGNELQRKDLSRINSFFTKKKVPRNNRFVIVDADKEDEFNEIDIVKTAQGHNRELLESGVTVINGVTYVVSALTPDVAGKAPLIGIYSPGIAVVIKQWMEREEAYVHATRKKAIDYNSYAAIGRTRDEYCCAMIGK